MLSKALIIALVLTESNNNPIAVSPQKAVGLTQITEIGIQEVQQQYGFTEDVNIFSPEVNVKYGILLLHYYYSITRSITEALILYNSGYAGLRRYRMGGLNALPQETQKYVPKVLSIARSHVTMYDAILPEKPGDLDTLVSNAFDDLYGFGMGSTPVLWRPVVQDTLSNN
jgi:soluble lytic murein transglycosylase-like protein